MQLSESPENLEEDREVPFSLPILHSLTKACKFIEDLNSNLVQLKNYSTSPNPIVRLPRDQEEQGFAQNHSGGVMLKKIYSMDSHYNHVDRSQGLGSEWLLTSKKENKRKKLSIQKKLSDAYPLDGEGFTKLEDGKVVFGKWNNGVLIGNAKIVYPSANIYIGEVKDYQRHGKGVMMLKNGEKYVGTFSNGKYEGYGAMFNQNGEKELEGIWRAGMLVKRVH